MSNLGAWKTLLKSVSTFRGDLSSMTAPPFILSPVSQLEYMHYWFQTEALFTAAKSGKTAEERMLIVLKWVFGALNAQYTQRNQTEGYEKKPLNPFLGELFVAELGDGVAHLAAEQVSHHPPISAFKIWTNDRTVICQGHVGIKARFNGTVQVEQRGFTSYTITLPDGSTENYAITLPSAHIEGLLKGAPFMELDNTITVLSSSGYRADLKMTGAGWVSGRKHTVNCPVYNGDELVYTIKGSWHKVLTIKDEKTGTESEFEDCSKVHESKVIVPRPIEKQFALESRKAWSEVAQAIRAGNFDAINKAKNALENEQRELRQKEKDEGTTWERRWFVQFAPESEEAKANPATLAGYDISEPFWSFDESKYKNDTEFWS